MQILPGVYLINGSPYGRHQNGYMISLGGTTLLIDSGDLEDGDCFPAVVANARRWGFELRDASHLLITHAHFDHASHAARLRKMGVKIVASQDSAEAIRAGDDRCIGYAVHGTFEPCKADLVVEDGQTIRLGAISVRCLAAPGHAAGLMVYEIVLHGERCWFVGDLLSTSHAHRSVELGWGGGPDFDRQTYLYTLRRLKDLPCDHLFPGHGPAAIGFGRKIVEKAYTRAMLDWR